MSLPSSPGESGAEALDSPLPPSPACKLVRPPCSPKKARRTAIAAQALETGQKPWRRDRRKDFKPLQECVKDLKMRSGARPLSHDSHVSIRIQPVSHLERDRGGS